jgi:FkbM family methyltransferase
MSGEELLKLLEDNFGEKIHEFVVLQIGANDGVQDDLIRPLITKYNPKSHLLEPVEQFFKSLSDNYKDYSNVVCHNIAISDTDGLKEMSIIKYDNSMPIWCKGLSTFDESLNFFSGFGGLGMAQDLRGTHVYNQVSNNKIKINVTTKKLETFLNENQINSIDVFVTDTEGHDFIIFNQLDLNKYSPKIIVMETHQLGEEINNLITDKLLKHGYSIVENSWDLIAINYNNLIN